MAQGNRNFTSITIKDGLPSNTVFAITKDRYGLMWFGTSNGLTRFDGTNFKIYRHETGKVNTLPGNEVLSIYEDRSGQLWIGTGAGGLSFYDRLKDRIVPYNGDGSWAGLNKISPRVILQDNQGKLWVGTYGDLRFIDLNTGHSTSIPIQAAAQNNNSSFVMLSLFQDSKNQMWIGTNKGLFLYNSQNHSVKKFNNNVPDPTGLSNDVIKSIAEDNKGNLWIATYSGLSELLTDGKIKQYKPSNVSGHSLSSEAVITAKLDNDGKVWIGTEDGLNILDPSTGAFETLQPDARNPFSLKSKSIRSVYIDNGGIYWIGTYGGGLAKYDKNLPLFNLKQSDIFDPWGLKSPIITSFAEYKDGLIFVGTDGAGIELFDRKSGLFKPLIIKSKLDKTVSEITILSLYIDHYGALWAGTYHQGLFRIDPSNGSYQQFTATDGAKGLTNNNITSLAEDGQGNLWVGTLGGGISIYNFKTQSFHPFNDKSIRRILPLNDFITSVIKSPSGELWIASAGTGIASFNPETGKIVHYTKEKGGLPIDVVGALFFDRDGLLWLSTEAGVCALNVKNSKIKTYTERDGLSSGLAQGIVQDNSGVIWISNDRGISSFDKTTGTFRNFNAGNGVQQGSFSPCAAIRARNGDIYFGGRDGFNFFNPSALPQNLNPGQVVLTDLKVSNESVLPGENAPIKEQIGMAKEINIQYGLNFSIAYVAVNYTAPKQNQFAYRLVGFEKEWNYVRKGRIANYTNLDPGNYVFQVKASSDNIHWTVPPTEVKITVFPPFWRTGYAYFSYVILALVLLLLVRRRGIKKIRREFELQQEKLVVAQSMDQERREADQLHKLDLLKIKFLTDISHEFRTPISLILAPVEKLLERKLIPEIEGDISMINRNVRRLLNMVNQLLDFRKMEEEELNLHLQADDIIHFIKETSDSFKDLATRKGIEFLIESSCNSWRTSFDHNKLERIIFNLLSNAFKFTPAGGKIGLGIEISNVVENEPHLIVKIIDSGIGIPADALTRIFDRFYQHQTNDILNQGTGIGLSITKEFVELHGGRIYAENLPAGGSCFVIDLPVTVVQDDIFGIEDIALNTKNDLRDLEVYPIQNEVSNPTEKVNDTLLATKKITVLLVEDNEEFRSYLADHLKRFYNIIEAADGKEGWQKTLANHPQLVVSDINMPVMSGIDLSTKIKADKRTCHIPVILLTAMTGEEEQIIGLKSGASDYLSKPFNFQILNTKIGNLLDMNKSLKDTYSKQIQLVGQDVVTGSANLKLLNSIMKYIEAKLSDSDLSVEELSKHVGMSRGSLYYKLIELTGVSPVEYIRNVKLEKAATLLENSELNVAQIAYMTGFGTPSYFSRIFKNKYGMVPSEYLHFKRNAAKQSPVSVD